MKRAITFLLALLVIPALPGMAGAHVEVTPPTAPAGKAVNLALEVGHGCDGAATNSLQVLMPPEAADFKPGKVAGWKSSTPQDQIKWTGGPLPDHDVKQFPFQATFYGKKGSELVFKIIQRCEGGAETAWIQATPANGAEPENPASVLTLTSTAAEPAPESDVAAEAAADKDKGDQAEDIATATDNTAAEDEDDGGSGLILPIIGLVLIGSSVTAFVVIQRGKKRG